jgi:uncharacterized protein
MAVDNQSDHAIRAILQSTRRIALVGASAKPWRPSHGVMRFLLDRGYDVTPVNPGLEGQQIHGRTVVARLDGATPLDMVDVFRNSAHVGRVVDDVIRLGAHVIWMQLGVIMKRPRRAPAPQASRSSWTAARRSRSVVSASIEAPPAIEATGDTRHIARHDRSNRRTQRASP